MWNGARVPADWPADALTIAIADEGAVASLVRAPRLPTLANLWAAKRLDIVNGDAVRSRRQAAEGAQPRPAQDAADVRRAAGRRCRSCSRRAAGRGRSKPIGQDRESDGSQAENKRNVSYHYDVSNAFYKLWLDAEMVYSCAYFHDWSDDLDTAQVNKLDMVCRKLRLKPGETMLDIGCGWGALACHAARHYGVNVSA